MTPKLHCSVAPLLLCALCIFCGSICHAQTNLRAWHSAGQTWLVWEDVAPTPSTYRIYMSTTAAVTNVTLATQVGRLFPEDWQAQRLAVMTPGATWRIPDSTGTGTYQLASNECVFAYTPHSATPMYFGVTKEGTFSTTASTRTGIIAQTTNPVQAHVQLTGTNSTGRAYTLYAHWVDGSDNDADQRTDYPLMADADWNGTARVFAVWEAPDGTPPVNAPAVIALHGGDGDYRYFEPGATTQYSKVGTDSPGAWLILPEDNLHARGASSTVQILQTFWVGWAASYSRFTWPNSTAAGTLIIPYTLRRVDWMRDWLTTKLALDPQRIALTGHSMGGQGCGIHARYRPAKYCGVIQHNPGLQPPDSQIFLGLRTDNNPVKLPGNPGTQQVFDPTVRLDLSTRDVLLTKIVIGKNDTLPNASWSAQKVSVINAVAATGYGQHVFWDERSHGVWSTGHWNGSPRILATELLRYRANQTFPALFLDDQNAALPGRQPDPGDGTPTNGDPWGTWSGYYDWDTASLADTTSLWAATIFLTGSSSFANDVPSFSSATASVALRRTQQFAPAPGTLLLWSLRRLTDNAILQSGTVTAGADGLVSIPGLTIYKDPARCRLEVRVPTAWTPSDLRLGSSSLAYIDSEFAPGGGDTRAVYFDSSLNVWIGNVAPDTGLFSTSTGQEQLLGSGSLFGSLNVNGPEWGLDAQGSAVFFTGADGNGIGQIFRASPPFDAPVLTQLTSTTTGYTHAIANATWNAARNTTLLMGYRGIQSGSAWQSGTLQAFWMDEAQPGVLNFLPLPRGFYRWIPDTVLAAFVPAATGGGLTSGQIYLFDADTGTNRQVSTDAGSKVSPWGFYAPELNGEMLIVSVVDDAALAIYRDLSGGTGPWTRIATLTLPSGTGYTRLTSAEPVHGGHGVAGASLFTVEAQTSSNDDSSIWILGLTVDATPNFARRVDDGAVTGAKASRRDPESFFGEDELLVYYSVQGSPSQMRVTRTGIYHKAPAVGFTRNGANYDLTLPTKSGATYQLQFSDNLTNWQNLGTSILGNSFDQTWQIPPQHRPEGVLPREHQAMKTVITIFLISVGLVTAQTAADRFAEFDKNRDGKLTREEFPAAKIFDGADADKDGLLTREEIAAYFRKQQGGSRTTPPTSPTPPPAPAPEAKVDIVETLNVPYTSIAGVDPNLLSLDIHAPKGAKAAPVLIYVHGGYWKAGDKAQKGHLPEFFCQRGHVFVSVNYRLAPAVKHPVLIQDVARAVAWVHDHIAEHGGDAAQLFLTGHSAGAQLVALLGTDAKRLGEHDKPLSILRGVIPLDSAAMDLRDVTANDRRPDSPYRAAFGDDPAGWADASPTVHAASGNALPPFQIVVAYGPAIANKKAGVDEFAATLRKSGTRAEVVDASSFREHQSLMTEFGAAGDPVSAAVLEFIESVRGGEAIAGLGSERVIKPEGEAAAAATKQLEAYRLRVLMMQFDKDKDGRITREEMSGQAFLFGQMDANKDGIVTAEELAASQQRTQPIQKAPAKP